MNYLEVPTLLSRLFIDSRKRGFENSNRVSANGAGG